MTMKKRFVWGSVITLLVVSLVSLVPVAAQEEEEYSVGVELVAEGLTAPVGLASPNDGSGRLFIVDQAGTIRIIGADGTLLPDPFLDLRDQIVPLNPDYDERGVLGLAFHPDYANNGRFFVYYTAPLQSDGPTGWDHTNVLAEFHVSPENPDLGDVASQIILLQIAQPQFNHDAGHIAFGPDGYLYVPLGDGGGANDNEEGHTPDLGNGQDTSDGNLKGSILRLDVNTIGVYNIPTDNPFVGDDGIADEIYAYGFRNPYHISFDRAGSGELFAADAGQDIYEEVDVVTAGGNYGWNIKEGTHCFDPNNPTSPPETCAETGANGEPLIDPIIEYSHDDVGVVVVGGYVYRGAALPELAGYYIFGDYTSSFDAGPDGTLWWAEPAAEGGLWTIGELTISGTESGRLGEYVLAVGEDSNGELYVLTSQSIAPTGDTGKVWRIVPASGDTGETGETGEPAPTEESAPSDPAATEESSG